MEHFYEPHIFILIHNYGKLIAKTMDPYCIETSSEFYSGGNVD